MQKTYNRINWENYPSDRTPLNETNLNKLDVGVNELDNRIITLDNTKFDKTEASQLIKNFELDKATGVITITYLSGATATIDTMLEKLAVNFDFDKTSQKLVIVLDDGTVKEIDLTALITEYEFKSTDTVAFSVDADGNVSAIVKDGSIQERHLRPNYLSDIMMESAKAEASAIASDASAIESENSAVRAESWTVGGTNTRTDEDTDNAKYYYEASKQIYNDFENVGAVVGVKGDNESDYRTGFVNITAENIGLGNVDNTADADKNVKYAESAGSATKATQDGNGNNISDTYATKGEVLISKTAPRWEDPLSTYTTTGVYHIPYGGQTDNPTTTHGTLFVETDIGTPYQIWIPDAGNAVYKRNYSNGVWSAWATMDAGKADSAINDSLGRKISDNYLLATGLTSNDLNEYKATGIYHITDGAVSNNPTSGYQGTLFVEFDIGTPYQIWIPDSKNESYKRIYRNNAWQAWSKTDAGNADNDSNGNKITDTYAKKTDILNTATAIEASTSDSNIVGAKGLKEYVEEKLDKTVIIRAQEKKTIDPTEVGVVHGALMHIVEVDDGGSRLYSIRKSNNWRAGEIYSNIEVSDLNVEGVGMGIYISNSSTSELLVTFSAIS